MGQYNNPAIGQAFGNLSELFAPPSGMDAYKFAEATAARQEAARKAAVYAMALDPSVTHETLDRANYALGNGTPSTGYYGVDSTATTARRGQDIAAQTSRYDADTVAATGRRGQDITAQTSRYDTDARNKAEIAKTLLGPLSANQTQPGDTAQIAQAYGFDGVQPSRGVLTLNQGDKAVLPDNSVVQGNEKPLDFQQYRAQQAAKVQASGQMPEDQLMSIIRGDSARAPVQVVDPVTQKPAYMEAGIAAQKGAQPYNQPAAANDKVWNYKSPSGAQGTAAMVNGKLLDTQTNQIVEPNSTIYQGQATGTPDQFGKPTETSEKNAAFGIRGGAANDKMNALLDKGYTPGAIGYEMTQGVGAARLPMSISNSLASPDDQLMAQAGQDFLNSVLRPDTGAAFSEEEKNTYARVFLPLPGDSPQVAAAKREARALAIAVTSGNSHGGAMALAGGLEQLGLPVPSGLMKHLIVPQGAPAQAAPAQGAQPAPAATAAPAAAAPAAAAPVAAAPTGAPAAPAPAPTSQEPVLVHSPEEAKKLAPGTRFKTTDGRTGTR